MVNAVEFPAGFRIVKILLVKVIVINAFSTNCIVQLTIHETSTNNIVLVPI